MKAEFINPFITSMVSVLGTMAMVELEAEKPVRKASKESPGDVSGLISMRGPQTKGSMAIIFEQKLAINVMKNMLGESVDTIDEQVEDMVGEMTNMICGGAKNLLSQSGYDFEMASPEVISGEQHIIRHKINGPVILLTFSSSQGKAFLEISFDK